MNPNKIVYTQVGESGDRNNYEARVLTNDDRETDGKVYSFDAVKSASKKGIARKARKAVGQGLMPVHSKVNASQAAA